MSPEPMSDFIREHTHNEYGAFLAYDLREWLLAAGWVPPEEAAKAEVGLGRPMCDHICLKEDGHVERGEPHFYGYELPSPRERAEALERDNDVLTGLTVELADQANALENALEESHAETARCLNGWDAERIATNRSQTRVRLLESSWVPPERVETITAERDAMWLALFQIHDEAGSWLRFGGEPRMTLDHIYEVSRVAGSS